MGNFDRQLVNALDKLHRELYGGRSMYCTWYYNGKSDIYHCPHTAVYGKDLMARMPEWAEFNNSPAITEWTNREQEL